MQRFWRLGLSLFLKTGVVKHRLCALGTCRWASEDPGVARPMVSQRNYSRHVVMRDQGFCNNTLGAFTVVGCSRRVLHHAFRASVCMRGERAPKCVNLLWYPGGAEWGSCIWKQALASGAQPFGSAEWSA